MCVFVSAEPLQSAPPWFSGLTCSHTGTTFNRPLFKGKPHETAQMAPPPLDPEALGPQQTIQNIPSETKRESKSPPTNSPSCESETPSASEEQDDTIFFTPELFESEKNPENSASPPRCEPPPLCERRAAVQASLSVRKESAELSLKPELSLKQEEELKEAPSRKRRLRLSRSRQRPPLPQAGDDNT